MAWSIGSNVTAGSVLTASRYNQDVIANLTEIGGAWTSWTPSWTNLTPGNGTVDARYIKAGRLVIVSLVLTLGSTSSVSGTIGFSLPANARATLIGLFTAFLEDAGTALYTGYARMNAVNRIDLGSQNAAGTYVRDDATSATAPFTWGNGDRILVNGVYEAAS